MNTQHTDEATPVAPLQWVHVVSERTGQRWIAEHLTPTDYLYAVVCPMPIPGAPRPRYASSVFIAHTGTGLAAPHTYATRRTAQQWCQRTVTAQLGQDAALLEDDVCPVPRRSISLVNSQRTCVCAAHNHSSRRCARIVPSSYGSRD